MNFMRSMNLRYLILMVLTFSISGCVGVNGVGTGHFDNSGYCKTTGGPTPVVRVTADAPRFCTQLVGSPSVACAVGNVAYIRPGFTKYVSDKGNVFYVNKSDLDHELKHITCY